MLTLTAIVTWTEHGKEFAQFPSQGLRPSFLAPRGLITSIITAVKKDQRIRFGESCEIYIDLPYGEIYKDQLIPGYRFKLQTASIVVAEGKVLEIVDVHYRNRLTPEGNLERIE